MRDETDGDGPTEEAGTLPPSLLPYDLWIEQAYRQVMVKALQHAEAEGLPGAHHFYITFRTTARGVQIPTRLLAQYPQEMTIVLQHQYWDLKVDTAAGTVSVGLSFGSVPSTLVIPFSAISGFADPQVRLVLRFTVADPATETVFDTPPQAEAPEPAAEPSAPSAEPQADSTPQVVSLDAFRRRGPSPS
jgi:hypothetical protein